MSASDDVPLTTYKFSVDQEATQATMTTAGINFKPDDVVTKDDEGSIQINGEIIKVNRVKPIRMYMQPSVIAVK